ncbi:hypothetical protein EV421DRAFT_1835619 [Armillaria borealis]|uniref:Secreted protein n=1 Tax=Armillaria borealis TaxID=47425 RepID=A0AA39J5V1_9AGAR|nr:hypothetical protein EV421DRAFT_1835619 [Armillaria borealis]
MMYRSFSLLLFAVSSNFCLFNLGKPFAYQSHRSQLQLQPFLKATQRLNSDDVACTKYLWFGDLESAVVVSALLIYPCCLQCETGLSSRRRLRVYPLDRRLSQTKLVPVALNLTS